MIEIIPWDLIDNVQDLITLVAIPTATVLLWKIRKQNIEILEAVKE